MQIETNKASLNTMSVTIRAMHVDGKQMTLAVFRQLPIMSAHNEDGSLRQMKYWGVVRYGIKDEGDSWVVCSNDGILYRCPMRWYGDSVGAAENFVRQSIRHIECWHHVNNKTKDPHDKRQFQYTLKYGAWKEDGIFDLERILNEDKEHLDNCKRAEFTSIYLSGLPQLFIAV